VRDKYEINSERRKYIDNYINYITYNIAETN